LLDCAVHAALAGVTALGWLGLGSLVLAPLPASGETALDALNRLGAGAVAFALLTLAGGWLGLLHAAAYLPLLGISALAGTVALPSLLRGFQRPRLATWPRWQLGLLVLLAVYATIAVVATCAPISSADALYNHAAAPELFEQRHRIVELPWSWNSYQPFTVEMLVTDGFLLWNSVQGAFAPLLLGLAGAAAVGLGGARLAGRSVGLLAATVVLAQPFTAWMLTSTFVEPGLLLALALAGWNLANFARGGPTGALLLSGLFAGAAAGMKYPGAVAAALLALAGAVLVRRRLSAQRALAFAVPALAVALPWYLKNWILTGNPVYPLLFGGANSEADRAARASYAEYGHGESPLDLVLLPFRLLADAEAFDRGEFVTPLLLLFAPLAFLVPKARAPAAAAWAAGAVYVLAWFIGSQQARFLMPLVPPFAVLAAVGIVALAARGRFGRLVAVGATAGALASGLGITAVYAAQFVPVVTGSESKREFLLENTSYYAATDWMNRNLPPDARVLLDHVFAFPVDRPTVVWTVDVLESTAGPGETRAFARRFGLTHAAVFATNGRRLRQLEHLRARLLARVTVRPVRSRTRSELGPPERMLVYELPPQP
jgi:4-amino-4-deoxy-L-arabinose transferase-like glycosyltransferase